MPQLQATIRFGGSRLCARTLLQSPKVYILHFTHHRFIHFKPQSIPQVAPVSSGLEQFRV
jgi:hypothetical protein